MSTFKDALESDLDTFINLDEFADEHELQGKTVTCVVQSPTEQEMFQHGIDYNGYEGTHGNLAVVHVKKDDFGEVPAEGQIVTLDDAIGSVRSCVDDMGMLSIYIEFSHA